MGFQEVTLGLRELTWDLRPREITWGLWEVTLTILQVLQVTFSLPDVTLRLQHVTFSF